ncbi:enoyl-CoA hydratase/isomerase family protein [Qipengyuania flava]|uniref:enoyl-CoA hydratase/isomerase family protein n=1 Tax=Qipengyuania flava TaxID=192812 RepID=UPI001C62B859|nr:enoyl-CoA hydratase/isomerase family protein [Qipengyuania flava]QYJ07605.1 enoyl-CoA hydratase/isomerase family protein [Qipengyuania flava]
MPEATSQTIGEYVSIARDGAIATVTFDRGDRLNALSVQAMEELTQAARALASDTASTAIVLTGGQAFSAGADLSDPRLTERTGLSLIEQREAVKLGPDMCQAWADLEQITICAIERFCIGGGLALAAACDHRVIAEDAHFRLPEVPLGMNMSWRSVPRLVALLGPARAKELVILGRKVEADEAERWGLADRVVGAGETLAAARELAVAYAALPQVAVRMSKQAIDASAMPLGYATSFMDRDQFLLTRMDAARD